MKWLPDNIPLAVAWRLLLLVATVAAILVIGMRQFDWRPVGEKAMPEAADGVDLVIQKEMDADAEPDLTVDATPDVATPTPAVEATPTPATPTPKPKGDMDEKGLADFLEGQIDE